MSKQIQKAKKKSSDMKMKKKLINFPSFIRSLRHPLPPTSFALSDVAFLMILLFFGFFSRTFRLAFPPNRVFDEVHFGGFTNRYIKHEYFHDIHPPLGKLLLAFYAYLSGYKGDIDFSQDAYLNKHFFSLRSTPATFSAMIPPVSFLAMRFFGFSLLSSILTSVFLATENMLIVESHLVLIDGFLHTFTVFTILGVSLLEVSPYSKFALIFTSIMAGCTFSIKYTGLSVLVFAGMHQLIFYSRSQLLYLFKFNFFNARLGILHLYNELKNSPLVLLSIKMIIMVIISVSVMIFTFIIHIIILDFQQGNDVGFMPFSFRNTLTFPNSPNYGVRTCCMSMAKRVTTLIKVMHKSNMGITAAHSASSNWYDWPLIRMRCISYYTNMYSLVLVATPVIWYAAAIGPILCLIFAVCAYFFGNYEVTKLIIWPAGYYASWVPFVLIPRVLFVYHYLVPLIFGVFSFAAVLEVMFSNTRALRSMIFVLLITTCLIVYIFFAPFSYALKGYDWGIRKWYKKMY
ncbi:Dolichyl-phosphate-mannose-protein mannosyltransferase [Tritrichomonas foetus]|uniref:Dolichyl-phosphate-mannose-protein mannosyltransferase n=1 Tax=Tritrichomonas foetus TaxID=1144522 RepID=A0A1J4KS65_9EUKA|nr:Dolichyl-phosphate-mannose-protein mannosyltransferase [Tritrichomonas foetus]|eukprot:OHT12660.1 Dolichyl-phosphate-mannose-protein mannosyltransferase [Tritrichomonas foetus]